MTNDSVSTAQNTVTFFIYSVMVAADFIMTIGSDDEDMSSSKHAISQNPDHEHAHLNPDFTFDLAGDHYTDILESDSHDLVKRDSRPVSVLDTECASYLTNFRNQSPLTTLLRDGSCHRILRSANVMLKNIWTMNRMLKKIGP
jgi:hypothetical protein